MDASLQAKLNSAIKSMQGLVGETAVINEIPYPCIVGIESLQETLTEGGWKSVSHVTVSINLADITGSPVAPALGNTVLLKQRNRTYRLETINPTQTTWELELIDITA